MLSYFYPFPKLHYSWVRSVTNANYLVELGFLFLALDGATDLLMRYQDDLSWLLNFWFDVVKSKRLFFLELLKLIDANRQILLTAGLGRIRLRLVRLHRLIGIRKKDQVVNTPSAKWKGLKHLKPLLL